MKIEQLFKLAIRVKLPVCTFKPERMQLEESVISTKKGITLRKIRQLMPPQGQSFSLTIWGVRIPEKFISEDVFKKIEEVVFQDGDKEAVRKELRARKNEEDEAVRIFAEEKEIKRVLKNLLSLKK